MTSLYLDEIDRCASIYSDFKRIEWLLRLLYSFRREITGRESCENGFPGYTKGETEKRMHSKTPLFGDAFLDQSLAERVLKGAVNSVCREKKDLENELEGWVLKALECIRESGDERGFLRVSQSGNVLECMQNHMVNNRDFSNLVLSFCFSTVLEICGAVNYLDKNGWRLENEGFCPVCGSIPHYGIIRGKDGSKALDCWLCRNRWPFPRLECPYCGNREQEEMGFFTLKGFGFSRVHFCRLCGKYHKVFDFRQYNGKAVPEIHHYATLFLDVIAEKEGFVPGSGISWVNESEKT